MRYRLKTLILLTLILPILLAWAYQSFFQADPTRPPPSHILMQLESKFGLIKPTMSELEVLETLGLQKYSHFLNSHCNYAMGGGGYNHKIYELGEEGYQLEFRDFMGNQPECILHKPNKPSAITTQVSQSVDMQPFFDSLRAEEKKKGTNGRMIKQALHKSLSGSNYLRKVTCHSPERFKQCAELT